MASIDFGRMTVDQLNEVIQDAKAEMERREEQVRQEALEKIKAIADEAGLSMATIAREVKGRKGTVKPKYRNPEDRQQTWTGRGKKPRWVVAALAAGSTMADLEI